MLIQFTLKNFKLFKEETLLDFIPGPINEHKASLIEDPLDKEQFLPVIAIHGPNGGGKSTVLHGLRYLASLITDSPSPLSLFHPIHHRMSPACADMPSEFDVLFRHRGFLFRYQLHLLRGTVTEENLFYGRLGGDAAGVLFGRKEDVFHLGKELPASPVGALSQGELLLPRLAHASAG